MYGFSPVNAKEPPPIAGSGSFETCSRQISDGPSDLAAAEAAGAHVNVLRGTVDDGLNALDVGLPHTVGATVGVAHLDTESNALFAELTLCHSCCTSSDKTSVPWTAH